MQWVHPYLRASVKQPTATRIACNVRRWRWLVGGTPPPACPAGKEGKLLQYLQRCEIRQPSCSTSRSEVHTSLGRRSTRTHDTRGETTRKHGADADEVWGGFGTRLWCCCCKVLCGSATAAPPSRPPPSILYSVGRAGAWGLAHEQEQDAL